MKKLCFIIAIMLVMSFALPISAAVEDIPSLFAGDEEWYKDSVSPLVIRDDVCYIPVELCSMFDYISVTTPREDNLLIHNTNTGAYISVLFSDRSAAANSVIIEDVSVFRDSGMFYVDAELVAESVGLTLEKYVSDSGEITLRLSDNNSIFTMEELIESYFPDDDLENVDDSLDNVVEIPSYNGKLKRIYVVCKSPKSENTMFSAQKNCELYGIGYTWFLDQDNTVDDILTAYTDGEYGIAADNTDDIDSLNDKISLYTRRKTHFTLTTGDEAEDKLLTEAGYIPIKPDFTVNGASSPDTMLVDILNYIGKAGSCILYLEDCWNSERMVILLDEIDNELYRTSNLSDTAVNGIE